MPSYSQINRSRADLDLNKIKRCRALYSPEGHVFSRDEFIHTFLIRGSGESNERYENRSMLSYYSSNSASIVDYITNCMGSDPLRLGKERDDETGHDVYEDSSEISDFWYNFMRDTTPVGSDKKTFQAVMLDHIKNILISGSAWIGIDMPSSENGTASVYEDEKTRKPYIIQPNTDQVINYSTNSITGEIEWLVYKTVEAMALRPDAPKDAETNVKIETFYWIDDKETREYVFIRDKDFDPEKNNQGTARSHGFGRVPWIRTTANDKWVMSLIYGLQVEVYNQMNFVSYAKRQSSVWTLALSAIDEEGTSPFQEHTMNSSSGREVHAPYGGRQQHPTISNDPADALMLPVKGRAEFVGPPPETFKGIEEGIADLRMEMYRLTHTLSLAADMDSAALRRSGDSKAQDKSLTTAYLDALGAIIRSEANRIKNLVNIARGSALASDVSADDCFIGARVFDCTDTSSGTRDAVEAFQGIPMISETATRTILSNAYQGLMGNGADAKTIAMMREEVNSSDWEDVQEQCQGVIGTLDKETPRERDPDYEKKDNLRTSHRR